MRALSILLIDDDSIERLKFKRVCKILKKHGASKPIIIDKIIDPEVEPTYIVENGQWYDFLGWYVEWG